MNSHSSASPVISCLLDTNIVEYSMSKEAGPPMIEYLDKIVKRGAELVISEISVYELVKGADPSKKAEVFKTIIDFKRLDTTKEILYFAALFKNMYTDSSGGNTSNRSFGDIDNIIAATSFHENAFLLTGDTNDFPRPFFKEFKWKDIKYKKRNKPVTQHICVLQPDLAYIKSRLEKFT